MALDCSGELMYDSITDTIGGHTMEKIETLKQWIAESSSIVFFGGAGVSTE